MPYAALNAGRFPTGNLSQLSGYLLIFLLFVYLYKNFVWSKQAMLQEESISQEAKSHWVSTVLQMSLMFFFFIAISSELLIGSAKVIAIRLSISSSVIAVTIVALGTSLPELVTALAAVRKGHGEIALGNVIGADILNVLLVAGLSASLTPNGLTVDHYFFKQSFPILIILLLVLRLGLSFSKNYLNKFIGACLLLLYLSTTIMSYL